MNDIDQNKVYRLEKYEEVNKCESFQELAEVIKSFAVDGMIQGRVREFDADAMAENCINFKDRADPNMLTREFGIRQQAMYIEKYT